MPIFQKRPVQIEARVYDRTADFDHAVDVAEWAGAERIEGVHYIVTLEGKMEISDGDYVIKGIEGEMYPCKPRIFANSYEPVEETVESPIDMNEDRFALEVREALLLEAESVGSSDVDTAIRVAARVAANYGLVAPSDGAFAPVDDPNTTEF